MDCSFLTDLTLNTGMFGDLLAQTQAGTVGRGVSSAQWVAVVIALAVMILPFVIGKFIAKSMKIPTFGTRFGWMLLAIAASVTVLSNNFPKLGVDLKGGTILVYELDPVKLKAVEEGSIKSKDLVGPLTRRINPSGTQEIIIRPYGDTQLEIIVPDVDQREVDRIKRLIEEAGILRFAIVANRNDHQAQINMAMEQSESPNPSIRKSDRIFDAEGNVIALWANVDREKVDGKAVGPVRVYVGNAINRDPDTGKIVSLPPEVRGDNGEALIAEWIDAQGMSGLETLMIITPLLDVTGEDLAFATSTFDQNGAPAVAFNLTDKGSGKFFALTTNNAPSGNIQRQLGIVLDDNLLSAPNINEPIRKEGRITGRFTSQEVESLVQILKAGQLPAALTKQPIAENAIGATLGADTITKGVWTTILSGVMVFVFMLVYYRFSGVIACIALLMNVVMIMATMVLINQPLTLPGMAGLVLTVGMSVDANVLIFERIREELKKGAAARMAIRNGFSKATITIVDSNLTTLITGIVLYAIGTDQVRGFAVTLILGILFSMFTAIYVARTLFDVAERRGFLSLSMSDGVNTLRNLLWGPSGLDFVGKGRLMMTISVILMVLGLVSIVARGMSIFDIDFAGGSSVQFRLDKPTDSDKVREIVEKGMVFNGNAMQFTVNDVSMENVEPKTIYKVDSSFEKVDDLKQAITTAFAEDGSVGLVTYSVSITPAGGQSSLPTSDNGVKLTAARAQEAPPADGEPAKAEGEAPATTDANSLDLPSSLGPVVSSTIIKLGVEGNMAGATVNADTLRGALSEAAKAVGVTLSDRVIDLRPIGAGAEDWTPDSSLAFNEWQVNMPLPASEADQVLIKIKETMGSDPVWVSSSSVGTSVAGDMIGRAFAALLASFVGITLYVWFRFHRLIYGFAAVAALIHDVVITLGAIAASYWLSDALGILMVDQFKISLTVLAAILTIIGYSLNDTIVVFDRIREVKGKATNAQPNVADRDHNLDRSSLAIHFWW
jgi:SecD/SecF fusion protein